jgi:hypothetical protein
MSRERTIFRYGTDRIRAVPRSDGLWRVFDEEWTGCQWRARGSQLVEEIEIETGTEAVVYTE